MCMHTDVCYLSDRCARASSKAPPQQITSKQLIALAIISHFQLPSITDDHLSITSLSPTTWRAPISAANCPACLSCQGHMIISPPLLLWLLAHLEPITTPAVLPPALHKVPHCPHLAPDYHSIMYVIGPLTARDSAN